MKQIAWAKAAKIVLPAAGAVAAFCVGVGCAFGGVFGPLTGAAGGQPAAIDAMQAVPDEAPAGAPGAARTGDVLVRINNGAVEWTAGSGWHNAGTLEELSAADPYAPPAVWEEYPSPQTALESGGDALPPQFSFAAASVPVPTRRPASASAPAAAGGGGGGAPAAPPSGGGGEPAAPSGGDGEDIGWSSDILD